MNEDFIIPTELSEQGKRAALLIIEVAARLHGCDPSHLSGGGCRAFYSPQEWAERGEKYCNKACLIVCHDGGSLAPMFNMDYEQYRFWEHTFQELLLAGFPSEQATGWYTCVYVEEES